MKIELKDLNDGSVYLGDKLNVSSKFIFEEDLSIMWSGLQLITNPPCAKELQIAKAEIFSKGNFESGEYIRNRTMLIKNNVVPTIKNRNLEYDIKLILRQPHPINPDDDLLINRTQKIEIRSKNQGMQTKKSNPISFSLSGLNINLSKDIFKPGETIKINFSGEQLKEIEIRLLQEANLICYCDAYGQSCRKVEKLPPAIAGDAKTTNFEKGFLFLKIPEIAEPSHNYMWEAQEKEEWGFKFGDYTRWSLKVIGKPFTGREKMKFNIPITIVSKPVDEAKIGVDLFAGQSSSAPTLFEGLSSKLQKVYKIISIDSDMDKYIVKIKNITSDKLYGVTVKLSGLLEGLFETPPTLEGFSEWNSGEEKEIIYATKQNVSALITILEDNSQRNIRIQTSVSSDFF
ncbi:MAG: hypothetical protein MUP85_12160 [Candidatus Lokiarchaeota archaeon]|nr:hypothetical protein [Candidatus Lokiarchaeota archaeon]